jgi:hypothetical protein
MSIETVEAEVKKTWTFLVDPGHLLLLLLLLIAGFVSVYEYDSRRAIQADNRATLAEQKSQLQDKTNNAYQDQVTSTLHSLSESNGALTQQLAALNATSTLRNSSLTKAQMEVPTMSSTQLSNDWETFINVPHSISETQGGFIVNDQAAIATVQQLEEVPVLKSDLADETTSLQESQKQYGNEVQALSLEESAHNKDNATCTTDKKSLSDNLNKAKADAKKSKFKWFFAGVVAGFIGGLLK